MPKPMSKGLDNFLYAYVCLLASMLYIHVCLSRYKLSHTLCTPWACTCRSLGPLACVVAFVLLVACLDVTACEIHLRDISLFDVYPFSAPCVVMLALPCLLYATCLAFFTSLHLCTFAYMFMHESLLLVSSSLIPTISCKFTPIFDTRDPESLLGILLDGTGVVHTPILTYICPPRIPPFSYNMLVCPFVCLTCLFAPVWLSLLVCLFACSLYLFVISFACLLVAFLVYCMYMHGVRMLGARARPFRRKQQRQGCK